MRKKRCKINQNPEFKRQKCLSSLINFIYLPQLIPLKLHNYLMEFGTLTQGFYSWSIGISVYLFHSLRTLLFGMPSTSWSPRVPFIVNIP